MTDFALDETALPIANAFNKGLEGKRKDRDNQLYTIESEIKEKRAR